MTGNVGPAGRPSGRPRRERRRPGSPRGQALVFLLPLVATLAAALLWVLDAGQGVSEKQRLVDATDAAALSAAVWQARTLNFESYMNRSIIANEAVIAQSVSLRSWSDYMNRLLPGASVLTRWVPVLNGAVLVLQRLWAGFDRALQPGLTAAEAMVSLVDHDLAAAQRLMHAASFQAVPDVVRATLAANDPRYRLSAGGEALLARWLADWTRFSSSYGGAWRWRQADVLRRSLDGFTESRNSTFAAAPLGTWLRIEKRGGTELLDFETWRSVETLSLHTRSGFLVGRMREQVPLGWGAAYHGAPSRQAGTYGGSVRTNPRAFRLADAGVRQHRSYLGLPSLRDLSVEQRRQFEPPRLVVRAVIHGAGRRTASGITGVNRLLPAAGPGDEGVALPRARAMYAMSAAETYFLRTERRRDGAREAPSLYSPYWRPRLSLPTRAERIFAASADGVAVPLLEALP
jgi:hypothetical protein